MKDWRTKKYNANYKMIADRYNISESFAQILVKRGLFDWDSINNYLFSDITCLKNAELMKDFKKVADKLEKSVAEGKKIFIVGDYDVDGVMSTYILYRGIEMLGGKACYRLPHRVKDGYGMRDYMADEALEKGCEIIVTCDNGISAVDAIERANELGITVLITDHHEVPKKDDIEIIPNAYGVVDCHQEKCNYPFKKMCGAGVCYRLMSYILEKRGISDYETELLPFAAIATVCDVVPLVSENRVIVKRGIELIDDCPNIGLKELITALQFNRKINSGDFGFRIGPCINAAGRLDDATFALKLFLEKDKSIAGCYAKRLVELNVERKNYTNTAVEIAERIVESDDDNLPVIVVLLEDCHESVAGIVAGKIREKYYKPTLILTKTQNGLKGSGRSIEGYHMQGELTKVADILTEFGGHAMAAGFSLEEKNFGEFKKRLNENCKLTQEDLTEKKYFDLELPFDELSRNFINEMELLEPIGEKNPSVVLARGKVVLREIKMCGVGKKVARLTLIDNGCVFTGVDFNGELHIGEAIKNRYGVNEWEELKQGKRGDYSIDLLYHVQYNDQYNKIDIIVDDAR